MFLDELDELEHDLLTFEDEIGRHKADEEVPDAE